MKGGDGLFTGLRPYINDPLTFGACRVRSPPQLQRMQRTQPPKIQSASLIFIRVLSDALG